MFINNQQCLSTTSNVYQGLSTTSNAYWKNTQLTHVVFVNKLLWKAVKHSKHIMCTLWKLAIQYIIGLVHCTMHIFLKLWTILNGYPFIKLECISAVEQVIWMVFCILWWAANFLRALVASENQLEKMCLNVSIPVQSTDSRLAFSNTLKQSRFHFTEAPHPTHYQLVLNTLTLHHDMSSHSYFIMC